MDDDSQDLNTALVFAGGEAPHPLPHLDPPDYVVAANGGLRHAVAMGFSPDVVVGDLDSADPALLAEAEAGSTLIERHPEAKDATDWELALRRVVGAGCRRVTIVGGAGGRLSHLLANALVLASDEFADLEVAWHIGSGAVAVARPGREVRVIGEAGDYVSLLAVAGPAHGVTTSGLRWALEEATLPPATSLGVSNELVDTVATVSLAAGVVLVIHEGSAS